MRIPKKYVSKLKEYLTKAHGADLLTWPEWKETDEYFRGMLYGEFIVCRELNVELAEVVYNNTQILEQLDNEFTYLLSAEGSLESQPGFGTDLPE